MSPVLKGGIGLGIGVIVTSLVWGFGGLYKNPSLGLVNILLFVALTFGAVGWTLSKTMRGYGGQIVAALGVAVIAIPLVVFNGYLFAGVLFPDVIDVQLQQQQDKFAAAGMSDQEIEQAMGVAEKFMTPLVQGIVGGIMTLITSLIAGLILAAFIRSREPA